MSIHRWADVKTKRPVNADGQLVGTADESQARYWAECPCGWRTKATLSRRGAQLQNDAHGKNCRAPHIVEAVDVAAPDVTYRQLMARNRRHLRD